MKKQIIIIALSLAGFKAHSQADSIQVDKPIIAPAIVMYSTSAIVVGAWKYLSHNTPRTDDQYRSSNIMATVIATGLAAAGTGILIDYFVKKHKAKMILKRNNEILKAKTL